ncbi:hypothetical protein SBADM41S_07306 [Streptomyces badius]
MVKRLTTTSSPGRHVPARVREKSYVSWVALRPKTIPPGSAPSRSPIACRNSRTIPSALTSPGRVEPRLDSGRLIASPIASMTGAGVWVPPGPSKCAVPERRAGNCARTALTSYVKEAPRFADGLPDLAAIIAGRCPRVKGARGLPTARR